MRLDLRDETSPKPKPSAANFPPAKNGLGNDMNRRETFEGWHKGDGSTPVSIRDFTYTRMMAKDFEAWQARGETEEDLCWLSQEYGQSFIKNDGSIYWPIRHCESKPRGPSAHGRGDTSRSSRRALLLAALITQKENHA